MSKITIELTNDDKIAVTYYSNDVVYPICDIDNNKFHISETTNINVLTLISNLIHQCGTSLRYQLNKQGIVNNALNKLTDSK